MSTVRLRTTGAIRMPLGDLPSGIFVVYKDVSDTVVLPVDVACYHESGVTTSELINAAMLGNAAPGVCIEQYSTLPSTEPMSQNTTHGKEEERGHDNDDNDMHVPWKPIPHPSHRMMTRPRPTIHDATVYRCPMEAYALSMVLTAVGARALPIVQTHSVRAFELLSTQFADLSPALAANHSGGRYGVQYRECAPDLAVLQMVHRWLASGDNRDAVGGVFVFIYGSVIRRPCPCGSGGLRVSVYTPTGNAVDTDRLSTDWSFVSLPGNELVPRLCRPCGASPSAMLSSFGSNTHILGRISKRTADACILITGSSNPCIGRDLASEYDQLLADAMDPV